MDSPSSPALASDGSGHGIRIVVIDSGVHPGHPHIRRVSRGVCVNTDGTIETGAFQDRLGHGTAVMAAIQEKAPEAEYIAVKLFHTSLRTRMECLLRAIEWAADQHADLINLSLGTSNIEHSVALQKAVDKALASGARLVSARQDAGVTFYPGSLIGVIGVCLDLDLDRHQCRIQPHETATIFHASGLPRPIDGVPPSRNLSGISFAVANVTGLLAKAWSRDAAPSSEQLLSTQHWLKSCRLPVPPQTQLEELRSIV